MIKVVWGITAVLCLGQVMGAPVYQQCAAVETQARSGIGNMVAKANRGAEVTVAYLGGSITAMDGWRNHTTAWLKTTWPRATFKEVHAAIGGTGSDLGVFRLQRDVLVHQPDLLFVEFATNDGGAAPEAIWRNMEGIVRQTWRANPQTDIVFTYTITAAMTNDYCRGLCNRSASAMEQLAAYYEIPTINFGPRVAQLINQGKLLISGHQFETAVPKETLERDKRVRELAAADARTLFAMDGVHPSAAGHELYRDSIVAGLQVMRTLAAINHQSKLEVTFVPDHRENAKMVPITRDLLSGQWQMLEAEDGKQRAFGGRMGQIWHSATPGSKLCFSFKGSEAKVYDLLGPDGGQVVIRVDGRKNNQPVPRFDSYCTYHRIATLNLVAGASTTSVHEIEIELHPEQPDRQSVAFRLKDPLTELKGEKYQGTSIWISQLLLVGDLIQK